MDQAVKGMLPLLLCRNFPNTGIYKLQAAGVKETYFGYDDDTRSIDSEVSMEMSSSSRRSSSRLSLDTTFDDDDVFEDVSDDLYFLSIEQ